MSGYFDQGDDDEDDGLEHLRQKQHQELSAKHNQFLQAQHEKRQAHMAGQAARLLHFHSQFGDAALHQVAKGLLVAQGPHHIHQIAAHLRSAGAEGTAKALATGAMQGG
jgi:hypothetical protein